MSELKMENFETSILLIPNNSNSTSLALNGNVSSNVPELIKNCENEIKNDNDQILKRNINYKSHKENQLDFNDDDDFDDKDDSSKSKILFVKVLLFLRTKIYQNLKKVKI